MFEDEKEEEKHLDARYGTKTGMVFFKNIAQINLKEKKIFSHQRVSEALIFRLLCLLNNLDLVGQSAAIDSFNTRCSAENVWTRVKVYFSLTNRLQLETLCSTS